MPRTLVIFTRFARPVLLARKLVAAYLYAEIHISRTLAKSTVSLLTKLGPSQSLRCTFLGFTTHALQRTYDETDSSADSDADSTRV